MKRLFIGIACGIIAASALCTPASAIALTPCPDDENKAECEAEQAELLRRIEAGEMATKTINDQADKQPTFITELDDSQQSFSLWAGKNLLLAGNNLTANTDAKNGLLLVAGNNLQLENQSEYGFVFGNIIKFAGSTKRDLYIAGNGVTLAQDAEIGRDVFVASAELKVESDLVGDLSVTADRVTIANDVIIDGNVNIDANVIEFGDNVRIGGKLVYNDSATVNNISKVSYAGVETYHVEETSAEARMVAAVYSKFLSIAGLFLVMALILAVYSKLHDKIEAESTAGHFGTNLAIGLGALVIIPIIAIFALLTMVAAPIGIVALLIYGIAIYLAQGFTGLWLGHFIIEKLCKMKGNPFIEVLIGIIILGLLALIPFVGIITGFVSLAFGLGLIVNCIKPQKNDKGVKKLPKSTKSGKATRR